MKEKRPARSERGRNRREFLQKSTAIIGGAVAASALNKSSFADDATGTKIPPGDALQNNVPPNIPQWMKEPGADNGAEPYGKPSSFEKHVIRNIPDGETQQMESSWTRTPLQELDGIITPNGLFYERHHGGFPTIDPAQHRLMVHGLVERPLILTMDDIRRFPSESHIYFLECSGNPGTLPYGPKTASDLMGLMSCAEWTGVRMKTILEEAGIKSDAKWVIAEGADAAALTRSIPIEKCLDDALLAYSQNGERLRPEQGYPLRVFLPGFEGNMSVKWVRRLHVTDQPVYSREETSKYTDLLENGTADKFTFYMEAKSVILRPSGGQKLLKKGFCEITGIAWSGHGKISRVDVSVDGGFTWQEAQLQPPVLTRSWTRFRLPWRWEGQESVIMSRAMDETGYVQPSLDQIIKARGRSFVYHNNAIQPWQISVSGEVRNANG
jgi:sulfane dehydrogenase subunit SoxC